jgi:hypothetical protein
MNLNTQILNHFFSTNQEEIQNRKLNIKILKAEINTKNESLYHPIPCFPSPAFVLATFHVL